MVTVHLTSIHGACSGRDSVGSPQHRSQAGGDGLVRASVLVVGTMTENILVNKVFILSYKF